MAVRQVDGSKRTVFGLGILQHGMRLLACERSGIRRSYSRRAPSNPAAAAKSQNDAEMLSDARGGATRTIERSVG
jgi:hypothetical protein